jgi:GGDEF domain-containing protein
LVVAERLRGKVKAHTFTGLRGESLSMSLGLVAFQGGGSYSPDQVVQAVDEQLYLAKRNGRNQVRSRQYDSPKKG